MSVGVKENGGKKVFGKLGKLWECDRRGGCGKKSGSGEDTRVVSRIENGGEERRNLATNEQETRFGVHKFVFAGFGDRENAYRYPGEEKGVTKILNEALVKRVIPFICKNRVWTRENKGTERDSEGVGWDMSIPQKLFIDWLFNGSLFPETSA